MFSAVKPPARIIFDHKSALRRFNGDRELLQELGELFCDSASQLMEAIRDAIHKQDTLRLRQAAHRLKGEVSNFGADAVVEAALRLEIIGRDENLADAEAGYATLQQTLEQFIPALVAFGAGEGSSEEKTP